MEKKVCKKCGIEKPTSEYYKHNGIPDSKCKECAKEYSRRYQKEHLEETRKYRKKYYEEHKEEFRARNKAWIENNREAHRKHCRESNKKNHEKTMERMRKYSADHPEKSKANGIVSKKIKQGKLNKPDRCSICGETGYIEAHHDDYSKPLDIIWCCKKCHWKLDEARREKERA